MGARFMTSNVMRSGAGSVGGVEGRTRWYPAEECDRICWCVVGVQSTCLVAGRE